MQKKDKKILIIEDEPEVLEPLGELLAIEGYTVVTASTPGLGASRAPYADCIILDLQLTSKNKLEGGIILSQIWEDSWCNTPIIIFSGMVGVEKIDLILKKIEEIGGNDRNIFRCIPKIEGIESVIKAVNEWYVTTEQSA